jgi:Ca2+-binding EF-hand superfamily protein
MDSNGNKTLDFDEFIEFMGRLRTRPELLSECLGL